MTNAISGDARESLLIKEALIPDLDVRQRHVPAAMELRRHRCREREARTACRTGADRVDVAVAQIEGESAVLAHAADVAADETVVADNERRDREHADGEPGERVPMSAKPPQERPGGNDDVEDEGRACRGGETTDDASDEAIAVRAHPVRPLREPEREDEEGQCRSLGHE